MDLHANAKLGLVAGASLCSRSRQGCRWKAARPLSAFRRLTAHRWWHRWLEGGRLPPRSSIAHRGRGASRAG